MYFFDNFAFQQIDRKLILVIDSGNTYTKIGQFDNGKLIKIHQKESFKEIGKVLTSLRPEKIIIGSVNFSSLDLEKETSGIPIYTINLNTPVPFKIKYKTPETLGVDRLAAIAAAWGQFTHKNILVIDAGTCITYDFIYKKGVYLGGGISPGIDIRFKSLHQHTAKLPLVNFDVEAQLIGDSTRNSILSGVVNGTIAEIEGIISKYIAEYEDLTIFMSGGSSIFFESKIKHSIFAFPNMVLLGLFSIYEFNVRKSEI
jgi:type III pantothenate kinase